MNKEREQPPSGLTLEIVAQRVSESTLEHGGHQPTLMIEDTENQPYPSLYLVVVLLVFVPPLAWYLLWKEKKYHKHFPTLIWLESGLSILSLFIYWFVVLPQFRVLNQQFTVSRQTILSVKASAAILALALTAILYGFFLKRQLGKSPVLPKKHLISTIAFLVLIFLPFVYSLQIVITAFALPIYSFTSKP